MKMTFMRRWVPTALFLLYTVSLSHAASAAAPTTSWWNDPAMIWDVLKWLIAGLLALAGWGIRLQTKLNRHAELLDTQGQTLVKHDEIIASNAKLLEKHESLLENHIKSLDHIGKTLDEWTIVKEDRAARLMRIETRLDRLDKIEEKLDNIATLRDKLNLMFEMRQDSRVRLTSQRGADSDE